MGDVFGSIIILASLTVFAVILFLPGKGLLAKNKRLNRSNERVLVEDALKHLYDCEYTETSCSINSIAGNLSITGDKAARLLEKLEKMGLLLFDQTGLHVYTGCWKNTLQTKPAWRKLCGIKRLK
jgi:DtxR family Mn-dependent transcriptional regulator